jgi:hypothetical protein
MPTITYPYAAVTSESWKQAYYGQSIINAKLASRVRVIGVQMLCRVAPVVT